MGLQGPQSEDGTPDIGEATMGGDTKEGGGTSDGTGGPPNIVAVAITREEGERWKNIVGAR